MTQQSQTTRIGQSNADGLPRVQFATEDSMPGAPWDGMSVYRTDLQTIQVFQHSTGSWMDVVGGVAGQETFVGDDEPVAGGVGDLWIHTPENILYYWDGTDWLLASAGSRSISTYRQSEEPVAPEDGHLVGDLWYDTSRGNLMLRWDGSTWVATPLSDEAVVVPDAETSDGVAPAATPDPVVIGGDGVFYVKSPYTASPDTMHVRIYASATSSFIQDETTYVGDVINGGTLSVLSVGGASLEPETEYFFTTRAYDADGDAPTPSAEVSDFTTVRFADRFPITETDIADDAISTPKLMAGSVSAEKVSAEVLVVGDVYAEEGLYVGSPEGPGLSVDATGVFQRGEGGVPRVEFPTDPMQRNRFYGDVETDGLSVNGRAVFRGDDMVVDSGSDLVVASAIQAPVASPYVNNWLPTTTVDPFSLEPGSQIPTGGMYWDPATARYYAVRNEYPGPGTWNWVVYEINPATSPMTVTKKALLSPVPGSDNIVLKGVVRIADDMYVLTSNRYVHKFKLDGGSGSYEWEDDFSVAGGVTPIGLGKVRDTRLGVICFDPTAGIEVEIYSVHGSFITASQHHPGGIGTPTSATVIQTSSTTEDVHVRYTSGVVFHKNVTEGSVTNPIGVQHIGFNGTNFHYLGTGRIMSTGVNRLGRRLWVGYTWVDTDPAGGLHETPLSDPVSMLQAFGADIIATSPSPPDTGDENDPNGVRLYVAPHPAVGEPVRTDYRAQVDSPDGDFSTAFNPDTTTGANPPAESTFPDGVPGSIKSAADNGWRGLGTGEFEVDFTPTEDNHAINKGALDERFGVGDVKMTARTTAPAGWLVCDGAAISRSTYEELFDAIGTTYGSGDGSSTFNVPDLRGRAPVGVSGSDGDFDPGDSGGAKTHTLSVGEMPSHDHAPSNNDRFQTTTRVGSPAKRPAEGSTSPSGAFVSAFGSSEYNSYVSTTTSRGGGDPHNNMPPYLAMTYLIKT